MTKPSKVKAKHGWDCQHCRDRYEVDPLFDPSTAAAEACPVCGLREGDHSDAAVDRCDRAFAQWPQERKSAAWREQAGRA